MRSVPELNKLIHQMNFVPPALRQLMGGINNESEPASLTELPETLQSHHDFLAALAGTAQADFEKYFSELNLHLALCSAADLDLIAQWLNLAEAFYKEKKQLSDTLSWIVNYQRAVALAMQWHLVRLLDSNNTTPGFSIYPACHYWIQLNPDRVAVKPAWFPAENTPSENDLKLYGARFARYIGRHKRNDLSNVRISEGQADCDCSETYSIPKQKSAEGLLRKNQGNGRFDIAKDFAAMKLAFDVELQQLELLHKQIETGSVEPKEFNTVRMHVDMKIRTMHVNLDRARKDLGFAFFSDAKKTESLIAEYQKSVNALENEVDIKYSMLNHFIQKLGVFDPSLKIESETLFLLSSSYYELKNICLKYATEADREAIKLIAHMIENKKSLSDFEKAPPAFSQWLKGKKFFFSRKEKTVDDCFKAGDARQSPFYQLAKMCEKTLPRTTAQSRHQFFDAFGTISNSLSDVTYGNISRASTLLFDHIDGTSLHHDSGALMRFIFRDYPTNRNKNVRNIINRITTVLKKDLTNYSRVKTVVHTLFSLSKSLFNEDKYLINAINDLMIGLSKRMLADVFDSGKTLLDDPLIFQGTIKIKDETDWLTYFSRGASQFIITSVYKQGDRYLKKLPEIYNKIKDIFGESAIAELQRQSDAMLMHSINEAISVKNDKKLTELYCLCACKGDGVFSSRTLQRAREDILRSVGYGTGLLEYDSNPRKQIEQVILHARANAIYLQMDWSNSGCKTQPYLDNMKALFSNADSDDPKIIGIKVYYYRVIAQRLYGKIYNRCTKPNINADRHAFESALKEASEVLQFCRERNQLPSMVSDFFSQFSGMLKRGEFTKVDTSQLFFLSIVLSSQEKKMLSGMIDSCISKIDKTTEGDIIRIGLHTIKKLFQEHTVPNDYSDAVLKKIQTMQSVTTVLTKKQKEMNQMLRGLNFPTVDFEKLNQDFVYLTDAHKQLIGKKASEFFSNESFIVQLEKSLFSDDQESKRFLDSVMSLHTFLAKTGNKDSLRRELNKIYPFMIGYIAHATTEQKKKINQPVIMLLLQIVGDTHTKLRDIDFVGTWLQKLTPEERHDASEKLVGKSLVDDWTMTQKYIKKLYLERKKEAALALITQLKSQNVGKLFDSAIFGERAAQVLNKLIKSVDTPLENFSFGSNSSFFAASSSAAFKFDADNTAAVSSASSLVAQPVVRGSALVAVPSSTSIASSVSPIFTPSTSAFRAFT